MGVGRGEPVPHGPAPHGEIDVVLAYGVVPGVTEAVWVVPTEPVPSDVRIGRLEEVKFIPGDSTADEDVVFHPEGPEGAAVGVPVVPPVPELRTTDEPGTAPETEDETTPPEGKGVAMAEELPSPEETKLGSEHPPQTVAVDTTKVRPQDVPQTVTVETSVWVMVSG